MDTVATQSPAAVQEPPWYRQFWPWFIIALPLSVVIAGFVTLGIAIKHNDPRIDSLYLETGLVPVSGDAAPGDASAGPATQVTGQPLNSAD